MASTTRELGFCRCNCDVRTLVKISDIFALISGFTTIGVTKQSLLNVLIDKRQHFMSQFTTGFRTYTQFHSSIVGETFRKGIQHSKVCSSHGETNSPLRRKQKPSCTQYDDKSGANLRGVILTVSPLYIQRRRDSVIRNLNEIHGFVSSVPSQFSR